MNFSTIAKLAPVMATSNSTRIDNDVRLNIKSTPLGEQLKDVKQSEKKPHHRSNFITKGIHNISKLIKNIRLHFIDKSATQTPSHTENVDAATHGKMQDVKTYQAINTVLLSEASDNIAPLTRKISESLSQTSDSTLSRPLSTESAESVLFICDTESPEDISANQATDQLAQDHSHGSDAISSEVKPEQVPDTPVLHTEPLKSLSSLAEAISQAKLKQAENRDTPVAASTAKGAISSENKISDTLMDDLKARLAQIRSSVSDDSAPAKNQPMNKFAREIAELRKQDQSEAAIQKRAETEAKMEARVAAALEAESRAKADVKTQDNGFIAELKRDKNGIPLPPPLPGLSINSPVITSPQKSPIKHIVDTPEQKQKQNHHNLLMELNKRLAEKAAGQNVNAQPATTRLNNPYAQEIAQLKLQGMKEDEINKKTEAESNARAEEALKMETELADAKVKADALQKEQARVKHEEFLANLKRDAKGIPVPPPLPPEIR